MADICAFTNSKSSYTQEDKDTFIEFIQFMDAIFVATIDARQPKPGTK